MGSASLHSCALEIWMAGAKTATGASKKSPDEDAMVVFAGTFVGSPDKPRGLGI